MTTSRHLYSIAGFVDDNMQKKGALLHGKEIFCTISELPNLDIPYDELLTNTHLLHQETKFVEL